MNTLTKTLIAAADYAVQIRECSAPQLRTVCADLDIEKVSRTIKPELVKLVTKAVGIAISSTTKAKETPKAKKTATPKATTMPSDRKVYNAVQKLGPADRNALATKLGVELRQDGKGRYVREIVRDVAKAIVADGTLPKVLAEHIITTTRTRKAKGEPRTASVRTSVIIKALKKGATTNQMAEAILKVEPDACADSHLGQQAQVKKHIAAVVFMIRRGKLLVDGETAGVERGEGGVFKLAV